MASHNLFFALWPGDALRERIASAAARLRETHAPHGRWTSASRYHLTVIFLGRVSARSDPLVEAALAAGDSARAGAFDVTLDIAGNFPNRSIPWWLGSKSDVPGLLALRIVLLDALREADFSIREDAPHVAHVTILRDADRTLASTAIDPIAWPVRDFVLIASALGGGSGYEVLRRWPLAGSSGPVR